MDSQSRYVNLEYRRQGSLNRLSLSHDTSLALSTEDKADYQALVSDFARHILENDFVLFINFEKGNPAWDNCILQVYFKNAIRTTIKTIALPFDGWEMAVSDLMQIGADDFKQTIAPLPQDISYDFVRIDTDSLLMFLAGIVMISTKHRLNLSDSDRTMQVQLMLAATMEQRRADIFSDFSSIDSFDGALGALSIENVLLPKATEKDRKVLDVKQIHGFSGLVNLETGTLQAVVSVEDPREDSTEYRAFLQARAPDFASSLFLDESIEGQILISIKGGVCLN